MSRLARPATIAASELARGGGFVVTYPRADATTLQQLRLYQQTLRQSGWLSRLEYSRPGVRLHVFRPEDAPHAIFGAIGRYGV